MMSSIMINDREGKRSSIHKNCDTGYDSPCYLFIKPIYLDDYRLRHYSGYIGFDTKEDLLSFLGTFKDQQELLMYFWTKIKTSSGSCLFLDFLCDKFEISAISNQDREELVIKSLNVKYKKRVRESI